VQQLHRSIIKGVQGIHSRCNGIDEVHLPRHQFRGGMQVVVPIGPFPCSEPAFDRNPSALPQLLAHGLCDLIPGDDALPESAFGPVAGFVPVGLDCCKREGREGLTGGRLFNLSSVRCVPTRGHPRVAEQATRFGSGCCSGSRVRVRAGSGPYDSGARWSGGWRLPAALCRCAAAESHCELPGGTLSAGP